MRRSISKQPIADLRHLQVPEARIRPAERGLHLPPHQVGGPGMPDDAPLVRGAAGGPSGH